MKFYFPDSQDLVSPTYDFVNDEYSPLRIRQRDDLYAHEVLTADPYHGILVSKAIVDGSVRGAGKYTEAQRQRFLRLGVRKFFRLPNHISTLGDCGAFNYVDADVPPYSVSEVLDFYQAAGFEAGLSVDHVILGYKSDGGDVPTSWEKRRRLTLTLAEEFLRRAQLIGGGFEPIGVAQGWSPSSYAQSVQSLQEIGYQRIALGGMVPLKTPSILDCLSEIAGVRWTETSLHLLGVTRVGSMPEFAEFGVTSFDSTSSFRQAFMDERKNYHFGNTAYQAIRVPQVEGNVSLRKAILAGRVSQREAILLERDSLQKLRGLDSRGTSVDDAVSAVCRYEELASGSPSKRAEAYQRTLEAAPWRECPCGLCDRHGVDIVIFRGTERNKRRGFHNLASLSTQMHERQDSIS